jgi:Fur family ferric uptake transcriptional regulator
VLTAHEIAEELRRRGRAVSSATVYRTLDALEELDLVQRLDAGGGAPTRYEPAYPGGAHHHHHLVCNRCGRAAPFEDPQLEQALEALAGRLEHQVEGHDVILTGTCRDCRHG